MGALLLQQWIRTRWNSQSDSPCRRWRHPSSPSRWPSPSFPGTAHARSLACGDRVTQDVKLTPDLRDCQGVGLVIAADGITLDLGGHSVDGTGRGTGIVNGYGSHGHRDVTIRNGSVRGFKVGLRSGGRPPRCAA